MKENGMNQEIYVGLFVFMFAICFGVIIETCPEIDSYHQMDGNYILKVSREQG